MLPAAGGVKTFETQTPIKPFDGLKMDILSNSKARLPRTYYQPSHLQFRHNCVSEFLQPAYQTLNFHFFSPRLASHLDVTADVLRRVELAPPPPPS